MKKFASLLLTALLLTSCANRINSKLDKNLLEEIAVTQEPAPSKIGDKIRFGGYDWTILDERDGEILILSEKTIEHRKFHESWSDTFWDNCDLREYLNNEFYNSFNDYEKEQIAKTTVAYAPNPWFNYWDAREDVEDYIFLLSIEEVVAYFGDSGQLVDKKPSGNISEIYALNEDQRRIDDQYNLARIAYDDKGYASFWYLRSPALGVITAVVDKEGWIEIIGNGYTNLNAWGGGIRPAMWLNAEFVPVAEPPVIEEPPVILYDEANVEYFLAGEPTPVESDNGDFPISYEEAENLVYNKLSEENKLNKFEKLDEFMSGGIVECNGVCYWRVDEYGFFGDFSHKHQGYFVNAVTGEIYLDYDPAYPWSAKTVFPEFINVFEEIGDDGRTWLIKIE